MNSDHDSDWAAIARVAELLGVGTAETVRKWARQAQVDDGQPSGLETGTGTPNSPDEHIARIGNPVSQYLSLKLSERLTETGIAASVGSVGDSYDNASAETINGLCETEPIKRRGPWRTVDHVEYATAEWVDWFNHRRLYEHCGDMPPAELEAAYYAQNRAQPTAALSSP